MSSLGMRVAKRGECFHLGSGKKIFHALLRAKNCEKLLANEMQKTMH